MIESSTGGSLSPGPGMFRDPSKPPEPSFQGTADGPAEEGGQIRESDEREKVGGKTRELLEEGKSIARQARDKAREWAHTAGDRIEDAKDTVGEGMEKFGGNLRDRGASAAAALGGRLQAAGTYLREHDFGDMNEGLKDVIRRHPLQSVLVGVGVGVILARALRSSA